MKRLLIDTNIYSHALRGDERVVSIIQKASIIGFTAVSVGELLSGFKGGSRERRNREELDDFLDSPRVRLYPVDENTAEHYAEIIQNLKKIGRPIPTNGIWISAVAFQYGLRLFSKDAHFKHVPGLSLVQ